MRGSNGRVFRRGDVWLVEFDPVRRSEQGQTRPAAIIQNDVGNQFSPLLMVAAIASGEETTYPHEVPLVPPDGGVKRPSIILLNQIRTVDKSRALKKWGAVSAEVMAAVDEALKISLGLVPVSPR